MTNKNHVILILCIIFIFVTANLFWIFQQNVYSPWDFSSHSQRSLEYSKLLFQPTKIIKYDTIYPPFTYIVTGTLFWLQNQIFHVYSSKIPNISLQLFYIVLLYSIYCIAKMFLKKNISIIIAVILTAACPIIAHFSRMYDLDLPLTSLVTFAFFCLIKTKFFSNTKWTILFAIAMSFGMLTKWTFIVFLIIPIILVFILGLKNRKTNFKNIVFLILITFIVVAPWYIIHFETIRFSFYETINNKFSTPCLNKLFTCNYLFYLQKLNSIITIFIFIIFFIATIICFFKKRNNLMFWLLIIWIIIPLFFLIIIPSKESRYLLPILPAIFILTASIFDYITNKYLKYFLAVLIILGQLFFWLEISFNLKIFPFKISKIKNSYLKIYGYQSFTSYFRNPAFGFTYPLSKNNNIIDDIISTIKSNDSRTNISLVTIPNHILLNNKQLIYAAKLQNINIYPYADKKIRQGHHDLLNKTDYIVFKTGIQGPKAFRSYLEPIIKKEKNKELNDNFILIKTWPVDWSNKPEEIKLYKNKHPQNTKLLFDDKLSL